jgi:hypothetical protein
MEVMGMSIDARSAPEWLAAVLLAEDDTEESILGSDLHYEAIAEAHASLHDYAEAIGKDGEPAWYVSSQVTIIMVLPERSSPWRPKPDVFVVPGVSAHARTSFDTRSDGPMPPFVLEVASESTWRYDTGEKATLYRLAGVREYLIYDPTRQYVPDGLRGWYAIDDTWREWAPASRPDRTLEWHSRILNLAIRAEGPLVRFFAANGARLPVRRELRAALDRERGARLAAEARAEEEAAARLAAEARAEEETAARLEAEAESARLRRELDAWGGNEGPLP